jgi:hypothetical protein
MTNGNDSIHNSEQGVQDGLTKREYFASLIAQSLVTSTMVRRATIWSRLGIFLGLNGWTMYNEYNSKKVCKAAVETADTLIEELNKTNE